MRSRLKIAGLLLYMAVSGILYAQSSVTVSGSLKSLKKEMPAGISVTAYIFSETDDILTLATPGCTFNKATGAWTVDCSRFEKSWSFGDILHVDFKDSRCGPVASIEVTLTNSEYIDAGDTQLLGSPDISAYPSSWDFGAASVGSSLSQIIQIKNEGAG